MRPCVLVLALLTGAALAPMTARAQVTQDRYDAAGPETALPAAGAALRGSQSKTGQPTKPTFLSWAGKVDALRGPEGESDGLRGAAPLDTSTGRAVRFANASHFQGQTQAPARAQTQPPPSTRLAYAQPPQQIRPQATPSSSRLPTSLYDQGYVAPQGQNTQGQPSQGQPPQARPTQPMGAAKRLPAAALAGPPPAQPLYQSPAQYQAQQPPAPYPAQPQQQGAGGEGQPRFYSLHREYGIQPDPTPHAEPSVLALSPTVAQAMADNKDDGPPIDLAGQDQASVAAPPRLRNNSDNASSSDPNSTTTTNANGQTTTTYTIKQR